MVNFTDLFPAADVLDALGDDVTYKRGSKVFSIKANIEFNVQPVGNNDAHIQERRTEAEILKTSIPFMPIRGDLIKTPAANFAVDSIISDDALFIKVTVIKQ